MKCQCVLLNNTTKKRIRQKFHSLFVMRFMIDRRHFFGDSCVLILLHSMTYKARSKCSIGLYVHNGMTLKEWEVLLQLLK